MSVEGEVYEDSVVLFRGSVLIKALEDIFRSIEGASSTKNMEYTWSIPVQPCRVTFVERNPMEPMLRIMERFERPNGSGQ